MSTGRSPRTSARSRSMRSRRIDRPQPRSSGRWRRWSPHCRCRPILPDLPIPPNGSAPPPLPLPPGVDRGTAVAILEPLTAERACRWSCRLKRLRPIEPASEAPQEHIGPLVAPAPTQLPRRHYFVVSKSPRGRESLPSSGGIGSARSGQFGAGPAGGHAHRERHDDHVAAVARCAHSTFLLPPTVKPVTGANATPGNVTPEVPPPLRRWRSSRSDSTPRQPPTMSTTSRPSPPNRIRMRSRCRSRSRRRRWLAPSTCSRGWRSTPSAASKCGRSIPCSAAW